MKKQINRQLTLAILAIFLLMNTVTKAQCISDFDFTYITCNSVLFNDLSTTSSPGYVIIQWDWDFGDGNTSSSQNPSHAYPASGVYSVVLNISEDSNGFVNQCNTTKLVNIFQYPSVDFTWVPEPTILGEATSFNGVSPSQIIDWYWDFDDGNFATTQNAAHTFLSQGTFDVELTVTDINGCQEAVIHLVTVTPLVPLLDYHWDISCEDNNVQFTVDDPPTDISAVVSWVWDFGDGGTSSIQDPIHVYSDTGSYDVSLTIVDTMNATNTVIKQVSISIAPVAQYNTEISVTTANTVIFSDMSSSANGLINSWYWDFGDGYDTIIYLPDNPDVEHTYGAGGDYQTSLTVTDNDTCNNTASQPITLGINPIADFTWDGQCDQEYVFFTDLSSTNGGSNIVTWEWDFGDPGSGSSNTSTEQNPVHIFSASGNYGVAEIITNSDGLTDTVVYTININPSPVIQISSNTNNPNIGMPIQFYATATSGNIVSWYWLFGDGASSTLQNPVHTYQNLGNYGITLHGTDINSCSDTSTVVVAVYPPPSFFPDSNAIWNTIGYNLFTSEDYRFRYGITGDTILTFGKDTTFTYHKVYSLYDSTLNNPNSTYLGGIRYTTDKKVYVKLPDLPESLLYDFSLETGDTIWFNVGGAVANGITVFQEQYHYRVITNTDSILLLDNLYHKRLTMEGEGMVDVCIEGVGSIVWFGLFNPLVSAIATNGDSYSFACFKHNDIPLYIDNPDCDLCFCYLLTDIGETVINSDNIDIYPNPTSDFINISVKNLKTNNAELRIYNSVGQQIYGSFIQNSQYHKVDVVNWEKGLYIITIEDKTNTKINKKFIID